MKFHETSTSSKVINEGKQTYRNRHDIVSLTFLINKGSGPKMINLNLFSPL